MRNFKGIICAAALAALGVVGTGCDDDDPVVTNAEFDAIDLNDDGLISAAEWDTAFGVWDLNDDGYIAPSEYLLPAGFNTLDADANGLLSQAEWDSAITTWDLNGDGFLAPSELLYY